jgi:predicted dehydrogenase
VQHVEAVGDWHQAHSYVRGNWRREDESSPMLLSKSCHDLDWLRYVMGEPIHRVSSFGRLSCFNAEHAPEGAAERCLDCPVEPECPYSAVKIYLTRARAGDFGWPVCVLAAESSAEAIRQALREGPYGRCVYRCDNDVVDHQVVDLEFGGGKTGTFMMTAFAAGGRRTRLFGSHGEIHGDWRYIRLTRFLDDSTETIDTQAASETIRGGHGGGDGGLMDSFLAACYENDPSRILSGPAETLETHLAVFAAERARRRGTVEAVEP